MEAGHVIYITNDLKKSVEKFRNKGFIVEYGKPKNPNNALIYFSEGAFLEILEKTGMPRIVKLFFKLLGKKKVIDRFNLWDFGPEGLNGLCLEGTEEGLNIVKSRLNNSGICLKPTRKDTKGRELKYKVFFPNDIEYPFFMTHFSINPRPKKRIHPNGISKITTIIYPLNKEKQALISNIITDNTIKFVDNLDIPIRIEFDKSEINIEI